MTKNLILSRLFSTGCEFKINSNYGANIWFFIGDSEIDYNGSRLILTNKNLESTKIEFIEIKEIKITNKTVTFIMQDAGYNFKDGNKKVLRRTTWKGNQC